MSRVDLDEERFGIGAHRFESHGLGAIQLYLGNIQERRLWCSHANHNTEKRARKWVSAEDDPGAIDSWDWTAVTRISSRVNRCIRRLAVARLGTRPILPSANAWHQDGGRLGA